MIEKPQVSIVTVGMNHLTYLKDLLKSVFETHTPTLRFEFIYVDNCSSDGSVQFIKENYPQVILIENDTIRGFGENNNRGVTKASGKYIAITNPDIVVLEKSIDKLFEFSEMNDEFGIVVPQLLNADFSIQYSVRVFMTIKILFWRLLTRGKDSTSNKVMNDYLLKNLDTNKIQSVDWAIGAFYFISLENYKKLKGFDEDYFLYLEDEDLCFRAWRNHLPVIYFPMSRMIHNHLRSSSKLSKTMYLHFKSMLLFFFKNGFFIKNNNRFEQTKIKTPS